MTVDRSRIPTPRDKPLFTPGPLTCSLTVKQAMLRDLGSREFEFIDAVRRVRERLLEVAGVSREEGYEAVLVQGSGTFGIESVIGSTVPPGGKILVLINGAYGRRIKAIADALKIESASLESPEDTPVSPTALDRALAGDPAITHVAVVHCETTTGLLNPVEDLGMVTARHGKRYVVDSMSAFGAVPLPFQACRIDFLIASANKCIEGVPGFSLVICRRAALLAIEDWARSLSLDLLAQWKALEANGQFRFTPPTHAILAFDQALHELAEEGGVAGRAARYRKNHQILVAGMRGMGFREYVSPQHQGYIITAFRYPDHERFDFDRFYSVLNEKGYVIYPGKVSGADCFRIGTIGRIFEADVRGLLAAIGATLQEMGVEMPLARGALH
jgi:2-aminoethylphosphonate-pyruvate transaminase